MTYRAGMSPAVVSIASPRAIGAFSSDSRCIAGPPAREIAAATPPPCLSRVLAALVIASTSSRVTSACLTSIAIIVVSSRTDAGTTGGTPMTAPDERQTLADFAETAGWHRRNVERTDYYAKGMAAISGGSLYHDDTLTAYTRDLGTVQRWLRR